MLTNICVSWPSERIYFALAGLDVANMNSGSDRDDFFIECLEQHGKSSEVMSKQGKRRQESALIAKQFAPAGADPLDTAVN